jgi:ATP-dependent helicase Lhr and Lhr-like helicase
MMSEGWRIFFRQRRPTPIQEAALPSLLRGQSALLSGPTASGKTEAAVAPAYQRHISFARTCVSVVYVAPTKALVNDLFQRLTAYFVESAGAVQRYTGDHHELTSVEGGFLVLATPEALDSLQLMRPEALGGVRAVIIDEIHALHGNARGQQLRSVIGRLRSACRQPAHPRDEWQIIGMSATTNDAYGIARLWLGEQPRVLEAGVSREIDMELIERPTARPETVIVAEEIEKWLHRSLPQKIIVFENTRNRAHELAAALHERLATTRWPVYLHLGALTREARERVEDRMKSSRFGVCVATSTLELGIDIGDLDAIVLACPPLSIGSFLQRIGRGNRRTGRCRVAAIATSEADARLYDALLDCAVRGVLDDVHEYDRPSVRFQQILSLAWRETRADRGLTRQSLRRLTGDSSHEAVLDDMLRTGALREVRGALIPSDEFIEEGDRRQIHTVLVGNPGPPMVDETTGDILAVGDTQTGRGDTVFLGTRFAQVTGTQAEAIYVGSRSAGRRSTLARFPATRGRGGMSRQLAWAIARADGRDPRQWEPEGTRLLTWGGEDFNQLIVALIEMSGAGSNARAGTIAIDGVMEPSVWTPEVLLDLSRQAERTGSFPVNRAVRFREPTRFLKRLSPGLQASEARAAVPFSSFRRWLEECAA